MRNQAAKDSMEGDICLVHGCASAVYCSGLCHHHHDMAAHGSADLPEVCEPRQILEGAADIQCNVPACSRPAPDDMHGLCAVHFARAFIDRHPDMHIRKFATAAVNMRGRLREAMAGGLPRADAMLLMLGYADGLTDAEIAEVLGITPGQAADRRVAAVRKIMAEAAMRDPGTKKGF